VAAGEHRRAQAARRRLTEREWITGTPKSKTSKRTVPLPLWLATRLFDYLANTQVRPPWLMRMLCRYAAPVRQGNPAMRRGDAEVNDPPGCVNRR
jgi:hypothetical protein